MAKPAAPEQPPRPPFSMTLRRFALASLLALPLGTLACSDPADLPPGSLLFVTGHESDTFTREPAPTALEVRSTSDGTTSLLGRVALPTDSFLIDDLDTSALTSYEADAVSPSGDTLARGRTVPFATALLAGVQLPVFVGRVGAFSRPPEALEHAHLRAPAVFALGRYLLVGGGEVGANGEDPAQPDLYDLGTWSIGRGEPKLPRAPRTMACFGDQLLLIDDQGASWLGIQSGAVEDAKAVDGLDASYGEVVGGDTIPHADGTIDIVGATRGTGLPTAKVLRIHADGSASVLALSTPRLGAAAAWIDGVGLVVAGGSDAGAGVEIAASDAFVALPYPPDAVQGAGLGSADGQTAVLVGGLDANGQPAPVRTVDLGCAKGCAAQASPADASPSLDRARVLRAGAGLLAVGDAPDGETHAYAVQTNPSPPVTTEVLFHDRRRGATAVVAPTGLVVVVGGELLGGGTAAEIETYTL